jgi:DNA-binding transcriptional LysR family regulator
LAGRRALPLAALAECRWILREPGSGTRACLVDALADVGIAPRVALELACDDAILCAVGEGAGLAIVDRDSIPARSQVEVLDVCGFPRPRTWHLAYPVGTSPAPAARALLRYARERVAPPYRSGAQNAVGRAPGP